jgi:hypothetical protein
MTNHFRSAAISTLCMFVTSASRAAGPAYRVIFNMSAQYQQPNVVVEGSPGVFYVAAGTSITSVTTQGTMTALTSFTSPTLHR